MKNKKAHIFPKPNVQGVHDFGKRCAAEVSRYFTASFKGFHSGEQQHVTYRRRIRKEHYHAVDADAESACGRHTVFECGAEILVVGLGFFVTFGFGKHLLLETRALIEWIVEFAESVATLAGADEELESFGKARIGGFLFGKRTDLDGIIGYEHRAR